LTIPEIGEAARRPRLPAIDLARGLAIVAMVVYHTAFDLSAKRLIATDVPGSFGWTVLARLTAGSFLLLVGISLVLAHQRRFNAGGFLRRLALVAGAAALVSAGTWWFAADDFVFFGILHEIAVASVLALPFLLFAPAWLTAIAAMLFLAAPLAGPRFDLPLLWPLGLAAEPPTSMDYVPLIPWFGVVLAGLVVGRVVVANRGRIAAFSPRDAVSRALAAAGRWSLLIYLVHQPLIFGSLALLAAALPPSRETARENFMNQCLPACPVGEDGAPICQPLCACMFDKLYGTPMFSVASPGALTAAERAELDAMLATCTETAVPAVPTPGN
jgi:uncharacterized membrane protein